MTRESEPWCDSRRLEVWIKVLESCLPTAEGYDDDTEQVLRNVIKSMRRLADDTKKVSTDHRAADIRPGHMDRPYGV